MLWQALLASMSIPDPVVPEPGSVLIWGALLCIGAALWFWRRRT